MRNHFLLLALFFTVQLHAQKEYYKWYFANQAAMDFVPGAPVNINNSAMNEIDNPATVSDSVGNLLFYSNGLQVWDRTHTLMPNGSGLLASLSGGHTATAVRQPGSSNLYYLLTMDAFAGSNGLRYNIIDMNLNGGLGDIVSGQKNIVLLNPASEQIVPVVHANGNDIWIVTHPWNSSSFNSYLITCSGLNVTPIVSNVGTARSGNTNNATGQINVNPTNDRITWANWGTGTWELFDFDNSAGTLSNAITFTGVNQPWAVEFSPNGSKLYLSGWSTQYVYQFDLSTYTQAAIAASQVNLGNVTGPGAPYYTGYMQLAPDGKIYIAVYFDDYLGVINNPDAAGLACNLVDDGFYLGGKTSSAGLPDKVVVTHGSPTLALGPDTSYCGNFTQTLSTGNPNTLWSTGVTAAQITVNTAGIYWASTSGSCGNATDTIIISGGSPPPAVTLPNDTSYCGSFSQTLSTANANTLWSTGATAAQINVSSAGLYWAEISNGCGASRDSILIAQLPLPLVNLGVDTTICFNQSVVLSSPSSTGTLLWSDGSTNTTLVANTAGTYWLQVSQNGCRAIDSIVVGTGIGPVFSLGADTVICGKELFLAPNIQGVQYLWQDNSTDSVYHITSNGIYSVTVSNSCGNSTDEIKVWVHADECELHIPTGFSPNHDGVNDLFRAISYCSVPKFDLHVYNRWGELVFETTDIESGWNGNFRNAPQPMDVFAYYASYYNECEGAEKHVAGNVSLIR